MNASTQYQLTAADLEALLAVTRGGSLADAGRRLNVDASTVFRTVQRIEKRLGQTLFSRSRSGYLANETALQIVSHAERIETELDAARAASQSAGDEISGLVRLTTTDAVLYNVVLPNLAGLAALHPQLRLELLASYEMANLSRRDADIAIRATTRPPEHLIGHKLGRLGMAMYASTKLVKSAGKTARKTAAKNQRPPTDLSAFDWVALDDAIPEHPSIQWRKKNYPKVVPRYFVNSHVAVGEMVRAGLGIGMLSTYQSKDDPNLVALTPPQNDCVIELWILTHPESRHLRRISAVYNYFAKAIKYVAS